MECNAEKIHAEQLEALYEVSLNAPDRKISEKISEQLRVAADLFLMLSLGLEALPRGR